MAKKQNWFQEFALRYSQTTPWFFKITMRVGLICTAVGTGLLALTLIPNIVLATLIPKIASNLMVAGVVMAGISKAATTTPQDLPNNQPNIIPKDTEIDNKDNGAATVN